LGLAALGGDVERARKEAGQEVQRARERWIKSTDDAPSLFSPDPPEAVALWAETTLAMVRLSPAESSALAAVMAHDPAPAMRVAAAEAVPWAPADKQWEILEPLLEDSDSAVRQAARAALPRIDLKAASAGPWLLTELTQPASAAEGESDGVPLVEALSHVVGLPGLEEKLEEALDHPDTAAAAARALAAVGAPEARAAILAHLKQPFALALPELLDAVAGRADPAEEGSDRESAAEACRALLFHPRSEVRAAAVRALKAIEGASAAAEVQPLAVDYDVRVRRAVAAP
jgi:HEAT repeat protein